MVARRRCLCYRRWGSIPQYSTNSKSVKQSNWHLSHQLKKLCDSLSRWDSVNNLLKQNIMKLDLNAMEQARLDMAQEGIKMTPLTQEDRQLLQSITL